MTVSDDVRTELRDALMKTWDEGYTAGLETAEQMARAVLGKGMSADQETAVSVLVLALAAARDGGRK